MCKRLRRMGLSFTFTQPRPLPNLKLIYLAQEDLHTRTLLKRIAEDDDKKAFTLFFNRYYSRLIQFALLYVPAYNQAEDIVSEVMIRLLRKRTELCTIENFQGYLFKAVKNEALNQLTIQKRFPTNSRSIEDEKDHFLPDTIDPCEKLLEKELREIVSTIIERLPPRRRMVYKMVKDEGMKYKEVGELLEISERTVEEHLKIAVRELRQGIQAYFKEKQKPVSVSYMKIAYSVSLLTTFLLLF